MGATLLKAVTALQNGGNTVTPVDVDGGGPCNTSYCPATATWSGYDQVWDARFYPDNTHTCSSFVQNSDYFSACWQAGALDYIQNHCGNFYLQGENAGFASRNAGDAAFLQSIGAVNGSYVACPTGGANSNDDYSLGTAIASTLPGATCGTCFEGAEVGGIPIADLNGTSFVHSATGWNTTNVDRSIVAGFSGTAQMTGLTGPTVGKLISCWDTSMWDGGNYPTYQTTTDTFFQSLANWMGKPACVIPTPTPTPSPTPSTVGCCPDTSSIISTYAGTGVGGYSGNGGPATLAQTQSDWGLAVDSTGNIYFCDPSNEVVREVSTGGIITNYAGNHTGGFSGDGGPATLAELSFPEFDTVDSAGNLYICDGGNARIRKVTAGGIISTFAGNGVAGYGGDNGPATSASINTPFGIAVDPAGDVVIADRGNSRIRMVTPGGIISTIAGNGTPGFTGDGGPATLAEVNWPEGLAYDPAGDLYFFDDKNYRVRKIDTSGTITTVAGTGIESNTGDNGPALSATLGDVHAIAFCGGNVYLADVFNSNIRMINPCGIISRVVGNGTASDSGDGGTAILAGINQPQGMVIDRWGNMYIDEFGGDRIRKITPSCAPTPTPGCPVTPTFTPTPSPTPVGPTSTPTITPTPTQSFTPTSTFTPTPTVPIPTFTPSSTSTPTLHVWPNPFNPKYDWPGNGHGVLRAYYVPPGTQMSYYTISGELVITLGETSPGHIDWNGLNKNGVEVSTGTYYYVIKNGANVLLTGKVLVLITN